MQFHGNKALYCVFTALQQGFFRRKKKKYAMLRSSNNILNGKLIGYTFVKDPNRYRYSVKKI